MDDKLAVSFIWLSWSTTWCGCVQGISRFQPFGPSPVGGRRLFRLPCLVLVPVSHAVASQPIRKNMVRARLRGRTPQGGVLGTFWKTAFSETPSKNPSPKPFSTVKPIAGPLLRTLLRTQMVYS